MTIGSPAVVGCCRFKLEVEALITNQIIISYLRLCKSKRLKVILAVRFAVETLGTEDHASFLLPSLGTWVNIGK